MHPANCDVRVYAVALAQLLNLFSPDPAPGNRHCEKEYPLRGFKLHHADVRVA